MWERYLVANTTVISWGRGSFPWITNGRRERKAAHSFDAPPCTAAGLGVYKSNPLCTSWIAGPQVLDLEPCWALLCSDAAFIATSCGHLPALKDGMMFVCHVSNGCLLIHCLVSLMSFVTGVDLFFIPSLFLWCCTAPPHPAVPLAGRKQAVSTAAGSLLPGHGHVCCSSS